MEEFVISKAEREGHFNFFEERQLVWNFVKENRITQLCNEVKTEHENVARKWVRKKDGLVHMHIEWSNWLSNFVDEKTAEFCAKQKFSTGDLDMHSRIIFRTIGKYVVVFQKQRKEVSSFKKKLSKKIVKQAKERVKAQPKYGLQVLAGGTIGCMFRLYKKNKAKYHDQYTVLRQMIITDKSDPSIPIQQRARDKGGFYSIRSEFLPAIKHLDDQITQEFTSAEKHGRTIIKVISDKVKSGKTEMELKEICSQIKTVGKVEAINTVIKTFVRKYTHARVGGHIRGTAERDAEKKGVRSKGGSSLRDKLYNITGKQKDKQKSLKRKQ